MKKIKNQRIHQMLKNEIKYRNVTPTYQKDRSYEDFIESLNEHLVLFEENQYQDLEEILPTVHIIGVPRSGTTLLTQLICSCLDVGYINNLIACFWKAPVSAIRLSRQILENDFESTLSSDFGRTVKVYEPHEFNYFWYDLLGYEDHHQKTDESAEQIDWERLSEVIKNMVQAFKKPIAFKSFMLGWHAKLMQQTLNKTCFVWIKRHPVDNALSLLNTRKNFLGSVKKWVSFKPLEYELLKNKSPYEQVAGQVYYLEQAYQRQIDQLPESNYLVLQYEEVCNNPRTSLEAVQDLINRNGGKVGILPHKIFPQQPSKRGSKESDDYIKIQKAVQTFYS